MSPLQQKKKYNNSERTGYEELKAQNQTLQTKVKENQEKNDEDLKILCKAKEELQNQNKEQNQQLKRLLAEKRSMY